MHHARRLIAILVSCATWCIAASSAAYAVTITGAVGSAAPPPAATGTPLWEFLAFVALGILLAVAIVGLGYLLSHSRRSVPSQMSQPPLSA
jgi:hypothetical protein